MANDKPVSVGDNEGCGAGDKADSMAASHSRLGCGPLGETSVGKLKELGRNGNGNGDRSGDRRNGHGNGERNGNGGRRR